MFSQHRSATHNGTTLETRSVPAAHITSLPDEILLLIFSQSPWENKFELAVTMLSLAKTCRRLAILAELSQVTYVEWKQSSTYDFSDCIGGILRILLRNPGLGRHIQSASCTFGGKKDDTLEAFTPHDWELARATIHRVCNLDAWNGQCRSKFHSRNTISNKPSQHNDHCRDLQADMVLRSDDALHLKEIQIPSITRGKLKTEWLRLLELNDYNARNALFLALAFGLKKVTVYRWDCDDWGTYPDLSTLSQNLVPILLLGAANLQHEQKILLEASAVSTTLLRHAEASILPRLFEVKIVNGCLGYCNAPMQIATPWLLPPSVKKARISQFGNEKISSLERPSHIIPWTPVPGLTLSLERLEIHSCSIPAEGLGLLLQSCPSLGSFEFTFNPDEGGGKPTSCIHPQDMMPRLLVIAHSLEHLNLEGMLWANGLSHDSMIAKGLEAIFVLGHRNGDWTLENQINETNASVPDLHEDFSVLLKLHLIKATRFSVDTKFGSFRAFTKLRTLVLKTEHLGGNTAQNLPMELICILPENLEHLWINDYQVTEHYNLIAEFVRLANMRGQGAFARMKSITLGDGEVFRNEGSSELRELSRLCKDVGITLWFDKDDIRWFYNYGCYPWDEYLD